MRMAWGAAALLTTAVLAGCTQSSSNVMTDGAALPAPQLVVVQTFATQPGEVQVDSRLSSRVETMLGQGGGTPPSAQAQQVAHQVADALADKLVIEIQDLGLQAQRGERLPPGVQSGLIIAGQLVSIDEGSRAERVAIGLGAGRSDVRVQVQVIDVTSGQGRLVDEIEVDAKSGLQPGMAETMGMGALTGHLVASTLVSGGLQVADESLGASVVADSDRAAKGIAKQLASFFAQQGWAQ